MIRNANAQLQLCKAVDVTNVDSTKATHDIELLG